MMGRVHVKIIYHFESEDIGLSERPPLDVDLGRAYNEEFGNLPDEDALMLLDQDSMFTTLHPFRLMNQALHQNRETVLVPVMNRPTRIAMQHSDGAPEDDDYRLHRAHGARCERKFGTNVERQKGYSGFVGNGIIVPKTVWRKVGGFVEGLGLLGVDSAFADSCIKDRIQVSSMPGLYLYHWYGGTNERRRDRSHLRPGRESK